MKHIYRFLIITTFVTVIRLLGAISSSATFYVSPMETLGLFGTLFFGRNKVSPLLILLLVLISDLFLNIYYFQHVTLFYAGWYWQYMGMLSLVALGSMMLQQLRFTNVVFASIFGPVLFYLISNFGVFIGGYLYPKTIDGFFTTYVMGLPFLKIAILNTLLFSIVTFALIKIKKREAKQIESLV